MSPQARERGDDWTAERVHRARAGDAQAFADLYGRYSRLVHAVLVARLPPVEVPDLVQEVFLLALRKLGALEDPSAFSPWIATIARRAAHDHHRTRHRRPEATGEPLRELPAAPALTADGLAIAQALLRLPATYRETLVLRLVEGMSGPEIAAATGMTEGSVRVNLCRGMKRLRAALRGDRDD